MNSNEFLDAIAPVVGTIIGLLLVITIAVIACFAQLRVIYMQLRETHGSINHSITYTANVLDRIEKKDK